MRPIFLTYSLIFCLLLATTVSFAKNGKKNQEDKRQWEKEFIAALQKGKAVNQTKTGGLAYTPPESTVLEAAIKQALSQNAPACEAMKIAADLQYQPYEILTDIFTHGGEVNLNQLCMCATETGINKQIVAQAATQAKSTSGTPVFDRDEIAQTQCLREIGLGYTPLDTLPDPVAPPDPPTPFSVSSAGL